MKLHVTPYMGRMCPSVSDWLAVGVLCGTCGFFVPLPLSDAPSAPLSGANGGEFTSSQRVAVGSV